MAKKKEPSQATNKEAEKPATEIKPDTKAALSNLPPEDQAMIDVVADGKPLTDNDLIDMSSMFKEIGSEEPEAPAASKPAGESSESSPAEVSPADVQPEPAKKHTFRFGSKTFETTEALQAYIDGIEQSKLDLLEAAAVPQQPAEPEIHPGDILFDDPKKAFELAEKQWEAKQEAKREAERRKQEQAEDAEKFARQTWENFYKTNPDLVGWEDVVNQRASELGKTHSNLPIPEALRMVAEQARVKKAAMRKSLLPDEELPKGPAITSGATVASVPATPQAPQVSNFISELKSIRKKGVA